LDRKNVLSRPPLANIDQVIIMQAIHQPEWHPLWCDRYLVHFQLELPDASFVLCFNKCDLAVEEDVEILRQTYEKLGYELAIVSAYTTTGLDKLQNKLAGKFSIFAGPSGVGKSTLLNALKPGLNLKTGIMENEYGVGRHTTTATEIYRLSNGEAANTWIADTPGFGLSELIHSQPERIAPLFPEIRELATECKYADCLHTVEQGCNILANLSQINKERYLSYMALIEEAKEKQKIEQSRSIKQEDKVKLVGGKKENAKKIPRLQKQYRKTSRRKEKQKLEVDL
jgi:ribosome biogenesis GTPase